MTVSAQQRRFVQEYLADLNMSRAARAAGYKKSDYGTVLLKNRDVQQHIYVELLLLSPTRLVGQLKQWSAWYRQRTAARRR